MLKIYKASAGSGKTYRLAYEYIKLVLGVRESPESPWQLNPAFLAGRPSLAHRRVLAITFTNKATEEMRTRIIKNLSDLGNAASPDDHDYSTRLMDEFGCTFDELKTAVRNAKVSLLNDFGNFNVSTIDSFFQTILRTFARELDIQGDYNIQINASDAIRDALNLMLDQLNSMKSKSDDPVEQRVKKWLNRFVRMRRDNSGELKKFSPFQRNSYVYRNIIRDVEVIFNENFKQLQKTLIDYLENPEVLTELENRLDSLIKDCVSAMSDAENEYRTGLGLDKGGLNKNFDAALTKFGNGEVSLSKMPASFKSLSEGDYTAKGLFNKSAGDPEVYAALTGEFAEKLVTLLSRRRTAGLIKEQIPRLELIALMMKYLEKVREDNNLLILNDTSTYISRIIGHSYIPFIYEHLGNDYRHFLIDEFQDTSLLQWENLLPLVKNSHDERDDSLIIGDVKQAIYRFRNSDSSILGYGLENRDFPDVTEREVHGTTPDENTNYRTAHGIVRFNNRFLPVFAAGALGEPHPPGYCGGEVIQQCAPDKASLPAIISFVPYSVTASDSHPEPVTPAVAPLLERPVLQGEQAKVNAIVDEIEAEHHERGVAWRDITVLVRNNTSAAPIIKTLIERKIPVQSAESLYLKNAASIRLILGILNMLTNAGAPDAPIRARAESEPRKTRKEARMEQALFESRFNYFLHTGSISPQQAIDKALDPEETGVDADLESAIKGIIELHPATLLATVEAIIARGLVPAETVMAEKDYISAFCDVVLRYSETNTNDAGAFLDWWRNHGDRLTVSPANDSDAVRVMSIHKAKGLEAQCVHIADFRWPVLSQKESMWIDIRPGESGLDLGLPGIPAELLPPMVLMKLTGPNLAYPGSPFESILTEQQSLMRADALNIAYVALTRAVRELFVYYEPVASDSRSGATVGTLAFDVLNSIAGQTNDDSLKLDIPAEAFNPETGALYLEVAPTAEPSKKKDRVKPPEHNPDMPSIDYLGQYYSSVRPDMKCFITVDSLERWSDDDDMDDDATPSEAGDAQGDMRMKRLSESTRRGVDLHDLLQFVIVPDDIGSALTKMAARPDFDKESAEAYRHTLEKAITPPIAARWFNPDDKVETEVSYFVPCDNALDAFREGEMRRIDRLVEHPDGSIDIVDYKFTNEVSKEHFAQVREYVKYTRRILPDRDVRGYLWYVDRGEIHNVN